MLPTFDEMKRMAEQEPEKLEALRQKLVEDAISGAPERYHRRLRGIQFQIDMERERAANPVSSCIRISKMMHDGLARLYEAITHEEATSTERAEPAESDSLNAGQIIPFPLAIAE